MRMIHALANVEEVVLVVLNTTKDKKLIIRGLRVKLVGCAADPGVDVDFFVVFELEGLVHALVVAVVLDSEHDVYVLGFVAEVQ